MSRTSIHLNERCTRGVWAISVAFISCFLIAGFAEAANLKISRAVWKENKSRLEVTGRGQPDSTVNLLSAAGGKLISTATSNRGGRWRFRLDGLTAVPCSVRVVQGNQDATRDVRRAPSGCDAGTTPVVATTSDTGPATTPSAKSDGAAAQKATSPVLRVSKARWQKRRARLEVSGKGLRRANVEIRSAANGELIGQVESNRGGRWRLRVDGVDPTPCEVMVVQGAETVRQAVKRAPEDCLSEAVVAVADTGTDVGSVGTANEEEDSKSGQETSSEAESANDSSDSGDVASNQSSDSDDQGDSGEQNGDSDSDDVAQNGDEHDDSGNDDGNNGGGDNGGGGGGGGIASTLNVLAANDLGMHCADIDYQVFSILPPFNVVHAQVIEPGANPKILSDNDVDVYYSAASNPLDPVGGGSINTTSMNSLGVYKSNFWETISGETAAGVSVQRTIGAKAYDSLYPSVLALDPVIANWVNNCDQSTGICDSALALFDPIPNDLGIPVPDLGALYPESGTGSIMVAQQAMPGVSNTPQPFIRFDRDLPFFVNFPFGGRLTNVNWFAADGIPLTPVDDSGRKNPYPLMKVHAVAKGNDPTDTANQLGSLHVVLPVAAEADCQNCHALAVDCADPDLPIEVVNTECTEAAISPTAKSNTSFAVMDLHNAPGDTVEQQLYNAAKINILRLHDAKHGAVYTSSIDGSPAPCDAVLNPADPNCLANQTPVQCSQCHYSPALDLAHAGPVDEPEQGLKGRQQTRHISMSRAMHEHHGRFTDLFPEMPGPVGRDSAIAKQVLGETCYQCHPGKQTQCLRGAMFSGGVVCQDCHGNMAEVGNDFTGGLPTGDGLDLTKRVPWADEARCQSCHTGDALDNLSDQPGALPADSHGIRLLQAFDSVAHPVDGTMQAVMRLAPDSRFAENERLYRLSKGHGGIMCEGCHGSTHAVWPIQNSFANDNIAANQLQGHSGTLMECDTCHEPGSLPSTTMDGPHGMHLVGSVWAKRHGEFAEHNKNTCRSCHGPNGEGTVLSVMAATRNLPCDEKELPMCDNNQRITLTKGTEVRCDVCHENEL